MTKALVLITSIAGTLGRLQTRRLQFLVACARTNMQRWSTRGCTFQGHGVLTTPGVKLLASPKRTGFSRQKPELATDIVKHQLEMGIEFDYVGGDGLYGNDLAFTRSVEDMGLVYMLDIHSDQKIHLEKPELHIPERKSNRGRPPKRPKASTPSVNANEYIETLTNKDWKSLTFVILPRES